MENILLQPSSPLYRYNCLNMIAHKPLYCCSLMSNQRDTNSIYALYMELSCNILYVYVAVQILHQNKIRISVVVYVVVN